MKKIALLVILSAVGVGAAEDTLFGGKVEHGGFGAPVVKFGQFGGDLEWFSGGRGAWVVNHTVTIGGGGYALASEATVDTAIGGSRPVDFSYGGLEVEYVAASDRVVHFTAGFLVGGGAVAARREDGSYDEDDSDGFFVAVPVVNGELNVFKFMRVDLGAGYRVVVGANGERWADSELSGAEAILQFKFGKF